MSNLLREIEEKHSTRIFEILNPDQLNGKIKIIYSACHSTDSTKNSKDTVYNDFMFNVNSVEIDIYRKGDHYMLMIDNKYDFSLEIWVENILKISDIDEKTIFYEKV
jgi:hypothetical protein